MEVNVAPAWPVCSAEQPPGKAGPVALPIGVRVGLGVLSLGVAEGSTMSVSVRVGSAAVPLAAASVAEGRLDGASGDSVAGAAGVGVPPNRASSAGAVAVSRTPRGAVGFGAGEKVALGGRTNPVRAARRAAA